MPRNSNSTAASAATSGSGGGGGGGSKADDTPPADGSGQGQAAPRLSDEQLDRLDKQLRGCTTPLTNKTVQGFFDQCCSIVNLRFQGELERPSALNKELTAEIARRACHLAGDKYEHVAQIQRRKTTFAAFRQAVIQLFDAPTVEPAGSTGHHALINLLNHVQAPGVSAKVYGGDLAKIMGTIKPDWQEELMSDGELNFDFCLMRTTYVRGLRSNAHKLKLDEKMADLTTWDDLLNEAAKLEGAEAALHEGSRGAGARASRNNGSGDATTHVPARSEHAPRGSADGAASGGQAQQQRRASERTSVPQWAVDRLGRAEADRRRANKECYKCGRKIHSPTHPSTSFDCTATPLDGEAAAASSN